MTDRTRLDEIINEEYGSLFNSRDGSPVARVALACFRHGVERGVHAAIQNHPSFTMFDSVRPAPAAEKAKDPYDGKIYWGTGQGQPEAKYDRRHGERRKP